MRIKQFKKTDRVVNEAKKIEKEKLVDLSAFDGPKYKLDPKIHVTKKTPDGESVEVYRIIYSKEFLSSINAEDMNEKSGYGFMEARMVDTYVYDEVNKKIITKKKKRPILSQDDSSYIMNASVVYGNCNIGYMGEELVQYNRKYPRADHGCIIDHACRVCGPYKSTNSSNAILLVDAYVLNDTNVECDMDTKGIYASCAIFKEESRIYASSICVNDVYPFSTRRCTVFESTFTSNIICTHSIIGDGLQIVEKKSPDKKISQLDYIRGKGLFGQIAYVYMISARVLGNVDILIIPSANIIIGNKDDQDGKLGKPIVKGTNEHNITIVGQVRIEDQSHVESLYDDILIYGGISSDNTFDINNITAANFNNITSITPSYIRLWEKASVYGGRLTGQTSVCGDGVVKCTKESLFYGVSDSDQFMENCISGTVEGSVIFHGADIEGGAKVSGIPSGNNILTMGEMPGDENSNTSEYIIHRHRPTVKDGALVKGNSYLYGNVRISNKAQVLGNCKLIATKYDPAVDRDVTIWVNGKGVLEDIVIDNMTTAIGGNSYISNSRFVTKWDDKDFNYPGPVYIGLNSHFDEHKTYNAVLDNVDIVFDTREGVSSSNGLSVLKNQYFTHKNPLNGKAMEVEKYTRSIPVFIGDGARLSSVKINPAIYPDIYKDVLYEPAKESAMYTHSYNAMDAKPVDVLLCIEHCNLNDKEIHTQADVKSGTSGKYVLSNKDFDDF